jgi:hypothetical protein
MEKENQNTKKQSGGKQSMTKELVLCLRNWVIRINKATVLVLVSITAFLIEYAVIAWNFLFYPILAVYWVIFGLFLFFLSPPIRRCLKEISGWYEGHLHSMVIFRLVLLFLAPLMFSFAVFSFASTVNQLLTLVIIGGSIVSFWILELPLLTEASIDATFATALSDDINMNSQIYRGKNSFSSEATFKSEKEHFLVVRVYNLGFHTYENATVDVYFGGRQFVIIPNDEKPDSRYAEIDFRKSFKIRKSYDGVRFAPSENNLQSIPPQGCLLFPVLVRSPKYAPKDVEEAVITVEFSSDNSWGMTQMRKPYKIVANLTRERDSHQNH